MRWVLSIICCATIVLLIPAVSQPAAAGRPTLQVLKRAPFVVRGTGFRPSERVTVTLVGDRASRRSVTAAPSGAFTVTFAGVSASRCGTYGFHAAGNRGSAASLRLRTECPPPPGDDARMPSDPGAGKTGGGERGQ
jgi:hypothetical protein